MAALTGRAYGLFDAHRTEDAERIIVAMGTIADSARESWITSAEGREGRGARGHVLPPVPRREIASALRTAKAVAVIERTDSPRRPPTH